MAPNGVDGKRRTGGVGKVVDDNTNSTSSGSFECLSLSTEQPESTLELEMGGNHHTIAESVEAATIAEVLDMKASVDEKKIAIGNPVLSEERLKRASSTEHNDETPTSPSSDLPNPKRRKVDPPTNVHPQTVHREASQDTTTATFLPPFLQSVSPTTPNPTIYSAAALFRRNPLTTPSTRKYTRPPISKLFMSLHLTPESFLRLQSRAKLYMLDPCHPERQSSVGSRGKGDADMVKLRLFNCVREFLEGGVGEEFFGKGVKGWGSGERGEMERALGVKEEGGCGGGGEGEKLVWPGDGNRIISLVTPLLRRMVTNERQRVYAVETRSGMKGQGMERASEGGGVVGGQTYEGKRSYGLDLSQRSTPIAVSSSSVAKSCVDASKLAELLVCLLLTSPSHLLLSH